MEFNYNPHLAQKPEVPYVFNKCFLQRAFTNVKQLKAYNIESDIKQVYKKRI